MAALSKIKRRVGWAVVLVSYFTAGALFLALGSAVSWFLPRAQGAGTSGYTNYCLFSPNGPFSIGCAPPCPDGTPCGPVAFGCPC